MIIVSLQERHLLAIDARARVAVGHVPPFGRRGIIPIRLGFLHRS
jgi:hypothetical protein